MKHPTYFKKICYQLVIMASIFICELCGREFAHGHQINPSWFPIELFLIPASAPQLV